MGWKDHVRQEPERVVAPWAGGRQVVAGQRSWRLQRPPRRHGWYSFEVLGREAVGYEEADADASTLVKPVRGYLVGDRLVPDDSRATGDPLEIAAACEPVMLIEPGIQRFARVSAGRAGDGCPLVYAGPDMPLGPEDDVLRAFQDRLGSVAHVPGVVPALEAAFRFETWLRAEAERRRAEEERRRAEELARAAEEERRHALYEQTGTAEGRRRLAAQDFPAAARAALAVGGAEYLDSNRSYDRNVMTVDFLFGGRRFNCLCDSATLRIVDAGICLTDHRTRERGDTYLTLESLPTVILQAQREGKLVVTRGAGGHDDYEDDPDDY